MKKIKQLYNFHLIPSFTILIVLYYSTNQIKHNWYSCNNIFQSYSSCLWILLLLQAEKSIPGSEEHVCHVLLGEGT